MRLCRCWKRDDLAETSCGVRPQDAPVGPPTKKNNMAFIGIPFCVLFEGAALFLRSTCNWIEQKFKYCPRMSRVDLWPFNDQADPGDKLRAGGSSVCFLGVSFLRLPPISVTVCAIPGMCNIMQVIAFLILITNVCKILVGV